MLNTVGSSKEMLRRLREAVEKSADEVWKLPETDSDTDQDALAPSRLTHLLELMLAGVEPGQLGKVDPDRIGYGSRVVLRDVETQEIKVLQVMNSGAMDVDAGHISLESPFGQALLGRVPADVVEVHTPGGARTLEVVEILTLPELLERVEAGAIGS
jgi:transcription elongation factor GreA